MRLPASQGFLVTYLTPHGPRVAALAALLLLGIGLDLLNPLILRAFIDAAAGGGALATLVTIALAFLGAAVALQVVAVAEAYVAETIGQLATNQVRADLTRHCLRLDPAFYATHPPGVLIERVDGDVATLGNYFARFAVQIVGNGLLLAGVLVLLVQIDWRIGLTVAGLTGLALAVVLGLRQVVARRWAAARQASADLFGYLEERLAGTEEIRANGATAAVLRGLAEQSWRLVRRQRAAHVLGASLGNTTFFCLTLATAAALGLGATLYQAGAISLGTVYLIFAYTQMLSRPIEQIARHLQDFQMATASIGRIRELLARRSSVADTGTARLPAGPLAVEFDAVAFRYAGDEAPVLDGLTFRLAPGRVLGLLGRTGSGKTTLTRLLLRLYDPTAGAIRLGGVDPRAVPLAALRRQVGLVTQEVQLIHASLRDNLTFFDPSIPEQRVEQALQAVGLGDWLAALPEGLDTRLAPGGGGLSAGEAQLLACARVFLRDPGLVILDEASSRLDPATERRLEQAIDRLLAGRTAIVIAHRLATVGRADAILILEDGRIAEHGPRAALAADPASRFAGLLRTGLEEVLV